MSERDATAFWVEGPMRGGLRRERLPAALVGDVTVRTLYSGVSRGTEALVFAGRVPASEHARMRAPFQAGEFPGPVKYGYANVGVVEDGDPSLVGRAVFCLYPHQDRYRVPADRVLPLPDGVPPARAVLAANLETAINGLWDSPPRVGEHVAVVGGGVVGLLTAWLAAGVPGCTVELVDVDRSRDAVAAVLGVRGVAASDARPDADRVFHASGRAAGLAQAIALAGTEATVVELSWYGDGDVAVPLGGAFHSRRLTLRSSQVGRLPPSQAPRWTHARRLALALTLLRDPRLDSLFTGEHRFDELPALMARLAQSPAGVLCERIRYP